MKTVLFLTKKLPLFFLLGGQPPLQKAGLPSKLFLPFFRLLLFGQELSGSLLYPGKSLLCLLTCLKEELLFLLLVSRLQAAQPGLRPCQLSGEFLSLPFQILSFFLLPLHQSVNL